MAAGAGGCYHFNEVSYVDNYTPKTRYRKYWSKAKPSAISTRRLTSKSI
jgi:hypothetical protein